MKSIKNDRHDIATCIWTWNAQSRFVSLKPDNLKSDCLFLFVPNNWGPFLFLLCFLFLFHIYFRKEGSPENIYQIQKQKGLEIFYKTNN